MSENKTYQLIVDTKTKLIELGFICRDILDKNQKLYLDAEAYCGGYDFIIYYDGRIVSRKKTMLTLDQSYSINDVIGSIANLIIIHRKKKSTVSMKWVDYIRNEKGYEL